MKQVIILAFYTLYILSCKSPKNSEVVVSGKNNDSTVSINTNKGIFNSSNPANVSTIMGRKQIPIICYHQIRDWKPTDSKSSKDYIIPPSIFQEQIKMLADSGYHTILLDQLYNYLTHNSPLPSKPVMLTFDDTDEDQFTVGAPTLEKYGFRGVFFIMTVSLNKLPHYMTKDQVKELSLKGHDISSHTWDHHMFTKYTSPKDWETQVDKPKKEIEEIIGKPAPYFAYPYGLWNTQNIPELKKHGILAAYQLSEKRDPDEPLYTIRRILGSGYWNGKKLYTVLQKSF